MNLKLKFLVKFTQRRRRKRKNSSLSRRKISLKPIPIRIHRFQCHLSLSCMLMLCDVAYSSHEKQCMKEDEEVKIMNLHVDIYASTHIVAVHSKLTLAI